MFERLKSVKAKSMSVLDRVLTIIVTATITSMVWIVAGGSLLDLSGSDSQIEKTSPAQAVKSPEPVSQETVAGGAQSAASAAKERNVVTHDGANATRPGARDLSQLVIPVLNVKPGELSDSFLAERDGGARMHEAIDIMAPRGTTVVAAAPGTIERIYRSEKGGNSLYVRSADKQTIFYYAHLDKYAPGLNEGQKIRRGQRLGTVGTTGNAAPDAPHLHFAIMRTTEDAEWWEPTNAINPYPYLSAGKD